MPLQSKNLFLNRAQGTSAPLLEQHLIVSAKDQYGRPLHSNKSFSKVLDLSNKEEVTKTHQWLKSFIQPEALFLDVIKTIEGGDAWQGIVFQKELNDKRHCLDTTITTFNNEHGAALKYHVISKDITHHSCNPTENTTKCCRAIKQLNLLTHNVVYINKAGKIINTSKNNQNTKSKRVIGTNVYDYINPEYHA